MSKLLDSIKAYQTNTRFPLPNPLLEFSSSSRYIDYGKIYEFKTTIGTKVDVSDPELEYAEDSDARLREMLLAVRHQIAHQVFGEFREPLLKLRINALKSGDRESAQLVEGLLDSMFKV